jgi:hypothetical protein
MSERADFRGTVLAATVEADWTYPWMTDGGDKKGVLGVR